jgi:hypothetical protein
VELLQRRLAGGKELALFRCGRTGNRLLEAQPVQHRECLAARVGVFNGKAGQILFHALGDVEGE